MAKYEAELRGNFDEILASVNEAIIGRSSSATLEDKSDFALNGGRCSVRIYERYSYAGQNRVSMSITLFEADGRIFVSAVTSGGSQVMFFKINTLGEESFLDLIKGTLNEYRI